MIVREAEEQHKKDCNAQAMRLTATVHPAVHPVVHPAWGHTSPCHSFVVTVTPLAGVGGRQRKLSVCFNEIQFRPVCAEDDSAVDKVLAQVMGLIADDMRGCAGDPRHNSSVSSRRLNVSWRGKEFMKLDWNTEEELKKLLSKYVHLVPFLA